MISAATASTAVLMITLVRDHGLQYLFAATVLMGIIQIVAGALRLGLLMKFVSRSVMTGFVNALAILIFLAQLPQLVHVGWQTYAMVGGRFGYHLSVSAADETSALGIGEHHCPDWFHDVLRHQAAHRRRHGRIAVKPAVLRHTAGAL